eukprot:CAMPEP_0181107844 /NCGR_PEP_ID=MMETSP1071-20121207/17304_1 /TAXON_ID=35127 /ORGANISM="Thalassiosira sp., Strain NH16" /LENGTH=146 /DNA_ID=CAMNT_0023191389 /DNA_START=228 /DNA_END=668 /DNA_ORIENTATION=+
MSINKRALLSGALGATASCIGKLALAPDSPVSSAVHTICIAKIDQQIGSSLSWVCQTISLVTRGVCLLCMIGVNALMISSFLDGMDESGSVVGTALSTAANFSCSAMYGILFFEEFVPFAWYFGASLIALGMWLLSSVTMVSGKDK